MATVLEVLLDNRDSIKCSACGNCCKGITAPCRQLNEAGLCKIHPSIIGKEIREQTEPDCDPFTDPVDMIQIGYYCPPLVAAIEQLTTIRVEPTEGLPGFKGGKIYFDRKEMNKILSMPID